MTKRLVRLHVTRVTRCMFCPSRFPKTHSPTICDHRALAEGQGRAIPDANRIPRWCPLPKESR